LIAPSVFFWRLFVISLAYSIITSLKNITKLERRCKNRKTENFFFIKMEDICSWIPVIDV
jgi:hypothetical protein